MANISFADLMLKAQHIPLSVGNATKISEHGICNPFHLQYFKMAFCPSVFAVIQGVSKQGRVECYRCDIRCS